jgi:hypothetical protein
MDLRFYTAQVTTAWLQAPITSGKHKQLYAQQAEVRLRILNAVAFKQCMSSPTLARQHVQSLCSTFGETATC